MRPLFPKHEFAQRDAAQHAVEAPSQRARDAYQLAFARVGVTKPVTNSQGKPQHRLSLLPSLGLASHVPPLNVLEDAGEGLQFRTAGDRERLELGKWP